MLPDAIFETPDPNNHADEAAQIHVIVCVCVCVCVRVHVFAASLIALFACCVRVTCPRGKQISKSTTKEAKKNEECPSIAKQEMFMHSHVRERFQTDIRAIQDMLDIQDARRTSLQISIRAHMWFRILICMYLLLEIL